MQLRVNPGEVRQSFGPEEEQEGDNWFNCFLKNVVFSREHSGYGREENSRVVDMIKP